MGTGPVSSAPANLRIVDSNGNVFDERAIFGNPVSPGEGYRVSSGFHIMLDASAPTGTWTATVTADPNNTVVETDETNNVHTLTFEVVEGVQLPVDLVPLIEYVNPYPSGSPGISPCSRTRLPGH